MTRPFPLAMRLLFLLFVVSPTLAVRLPDPPPPVQIINHAPTGDAPPATPPMTTMPAPAPSVPRADFEKDAFPSGPFKNSPPPSVIPPPLAPSGRWLFTMVLSESDAFVYGGVGSYSTLLYNDLWMFSFVEDAWSQIHSSYIPPFPVQKRKTKVNIPPLQNFRVPSVPPAPGMRGPPKKQATVAVPVHPRAAPAGSGPLESTGPVTPIPIVTWSPIAVQPLKMTDYSPVYFLELDESRIPSLSSSSSSSTFRHAHRSRPIAAAPITAPHNNIQTSEDNLSDFTSFLELSLKAKTKARVRTGLRGRTVHQLRALQRIKLENRAYIGMQTEAHAGALTATHVNNHLRSLIGLKGTMEAPNPLDNYNKMNPFISTDLWKYNLETKTWNNIFSKSPNLPAPRWLHSAAIVSGRLVIFGGVSYSDIILGDLWVFNPDDASWMKATPGGPPILPREGHTACVLNEVEMHVFGGISYGHVPFNDLWNYDAKKNKWALVKPKGALLPPPRWMHTATYYQDINKKQEFMIIFGGVTRNWIPLDDLWIFDYKKKQWVHPKVVGYPPFPRMLHAACMAGTKLLIHGGVANNIPFEDFWFFDVEESVWSEHVPSTAYPFAREGHGMVYVSSPPPKLEPQVRPEWVPPNKEAASVGDPLTPLIHNWTTPRPLNRYIKDTSLQSYIFVFGGAGPKPREEDMG